MPRTPTSSLVEQRLDEQNGGEGARFVEMRVDVVDETTDEMLLSVGGRWDRRLRRYVGKARKRRALRVHPGQVEPAKWFARWLRAHEAGERLRVKCTKGERAVWSCLFTGGRRSGKTDLSMKAAVAYAVARPRSIVWIIVPVFDDAPEIERALEEAMPRAWYRPSERLWTLINGSEIYLKSSDDPEGLKKGRCDLAVISEAQKHDKVAYGILRPQIGDKGGLVLMTANPPRTVRGEWVAEHHDKVAAGKIGGVSFHFDFRKNPHIVREALEDLADELDEDMYAVEVEGEFRPRRDVVFYSWSDALNVMPRPDLGNVTRAFTEKHFGQAADFVIGLDFQRSPHIAGVALEAFRDPEATDGEPLLWYSDEIVLDQADEDMLCDALEAEGYTPANTILVGDASAEWQDVKRTRGKGSFDWLKNRGWRGRIFKPDPKMQKNPIVEQRVGVANARYCSAKRKRRVFLDPQCIKLRAALRKWGLKHGVPHRQSEYAHLCDAATYPLWRFYPRRATPAPVAYEAIEGGAGVRAEQMRGVFAPRRLEDDDA